MDGKRRERWLVVLALVCFGALAGDKMVVSPLVKLWKTRRERIVALEQSLSKGHALLERETMMNQRWEGMKTRGLPLEPSVAENEVLQAVSRWSRESRLGVNSQKPRWVRDEEDHTRLEWRVTAQGGLESIARFLYEMEHDPLAVKIETAQIAAAGDTANNLTLDVQFTGLLLTGAKEQ